MKQDAAAVAAATKPLAELFDGSGVCTDYRLTPAEFATLRRFTIERWLTVLRQEAPQHAAAFEREGIEHYHRLAHLIDHDRIWNTMTRTFPADMADTIQSFGLFKVFDRECPGWRISGAMPPYGDLGRPRINWRLVRPGANKDIGKIHADYWFDAVLDDWTDARDDYLRVKVWIPIVSEMGVTGLEIAPGSQRERPAFVRIPLPDGTFKPGLDATRANVSLRTLDLDPGQAAIFSFDLVHRGANADAAHTTRVSVEFGILAPRAELESRYGSLKSFF